MSINYIMIYQNPKLSFTEFHVNMVFGFLATPMCGFETWFEKNLRESQKSGKIERSGWTPVYRLPSGPDVVLQRIIDRDFYLKLMGKSPKGLSETDNSDISIIYPDLWKERESNQCKEIKVKLHFSLALKKSGAGALTITLSFDAKPDGLHYSTRDVLSALLLAPRTEYGLPLKGSSNSEYYKWDLELAKISPEIEKMLELGLSDPVVAKQIALPAEPLSNFSSAFKLFLLGMIALLKMTGSESAANKEDEINLLRWTEFSEIPENELQVAEKDENYRFEFPIYEGAIRDPQIPYMYVVGQVPKDMYLEAFAEEGLDYVETRRLRSKYTKDIGSILNRWLDSRNIPYASCDHLEQEGLTREGAFLSNYMNSMLFTTFSATTAITLQPSHEGDGGTEPPWQLPFEPAIHSILQFIEFSRMRWHQGISINRALDGLIDHAKEASERSIPALMQSLLEQRLKVARYMQNPITYRWDATVGSKVARYIDKQVIGELEEATLRKLALVKEIIVDRVDILRTQSVLRSLGEKLKED